MKSTLIFDVDGIILDFNRDFVEYCAGLPSDRRLHLDPRPKTWDFDIDPVTEKEKYRLLRQAMYDFHLDHPPLRLEDEKIPGLMSRLQEKYHIVLLTSYPDHRKRVHNLVYHGIPYDELHCGIGDKRTFILNLQRNIAAVFEDAPHHLEKYIDVVPHYKIWIPRKYPYTHYLGEIYLLNYYSDVEEWLNLIED